MTNPVIRICDEAFTPDPLGGLFWAREKTLIVSDLHFEKGSSFAERGVLLPPYDTKTTIDRVRALMRRYAPGRVISLGDAFHDGRAEDRLDANDLQALADLVKSVEWIWIEGNHDPAPPKRLAARSEKQLRIGEISFVHEPTANARGEIAGHLHPCASIVHERRRLRRRCFAVGAEQIVMPALGAYTGGLNILDLAFESLGAVFQPWVMGEKGVYPIARDKIRPDTLRRHGDRAAS
ncbi:MAG: ligase-associated DNA damage response endonuclease PdeM [Pseudomonadota bacterium]